MSKAPSTVSPLRTITCEYAGRAFADRFYGPIQAAPPPSDAAVTASGINLHDDSSEQLRQRWLKADVDDVYALLDLKAKSTDATDDEIRKAYRTISLVCHPDKAPLNLRAAAEERFKSLQSGFQILTDSSRRRAYDSSLDFDDAIPSERAGATESDFFKVYAPVFARNERFSQVKPVPKLGDMSTSNDAVHAFYDFWLSFKSWRDFAYLDEHKINESTGREEKRWMARENAKAQAGKKKEELNRVRKLAEDAMRKDPRIARMRRDEDEEKNKKKRAKLDVVKAKAEAERAAKEAEEARAAAERKDKETAAAADKEAKLKLKSFRSYFGKYCREAGLPDDEIERLRAKLTLDEFTAIVNAFKADANSADGKDLFWSAVERCGGEDKDKAARSEARMAEEKAKREAAAKAAAVQSELPWSLTEEQALTKAIAKYPGGVTQRWEKITEVVNGELGRRTMKDVLKKAKELDARGGSHGTGGDDAFQRYLARMHKDAHSSELTRLRNMSEDERAHFLAEEDSKQNAEKLKLAEAEETARRAVEEERNARVNAAPPSAASLRAAEKLRQQREKDAAAERAETEQKAKSAAPQSKKPQNKAANKPAAAAQPNTTNSLSKADTTEEHKTNSTAPAVVSAVSAAPSADDWTAEEQSALESALRTIPKDGSNDRWERIAALVKSKTTKQCIARFKHIRKEIIAKS